MTLDAEAAEAVAALRRETGVSVSSAVNTLIHRGAVGPVRPDYVVPDITFKLSARMLIDRPGDVLS